MPGTAFDDQVRTVGDRFGWLKAHSCPCTYARGTPGSPNPGCLTCSGRGVYWDEPLDFTGLFTYMHTSSAPDEPGAMTSELLGHVLKAEPTLTIPWNGGAGTEAIVWAEASSFDAFVWYDARTRFDTVLVVPEGPGAPTNVLPYQWGTDVQCVVAYDVAANHIVPVASGNWSIASGVVALSPATSFVPGTAFTVEYFASPVMVAFRDAGGIPHVRPFAQGRAAIPRRFHLKLLDAWLRDRIGGELPGAGLVPPRYG
jgi:hypothetical protein